jgi:TupA-like ATPgrasp/Glycosyl transferase family 2
MPPGNAQPGTDATTRPEGQVRTAGVSLPASWPSVSVVIPALNEARNLPHVLSRLPGGLHEVIVVDGHSVDNTCAVARALRPDARIVTQTRRGKGNALACGFAAATGEIIVMLDADGSADAGEIPAFVQALLDGADFAKGTRFAEGGGSNDLTRLRALGNRALMAMVNLSYRTAYSDLCYGFNVFWRRHLPVLTLDATTPLPRDGAGGLWGDGFEIETLIAIRVAIARLRVVEVPSFEHPRIHGVSNLTAFSDGLRVLRTILTERRERHTLPSQHHQHQHQHQDRQHQDQPHAPSGYGHEAAAGPASRLRGAARSSVYRLPAGLERRLLFAYHNRKLPHFARPVTFSDKVNWRILNDRRPLLEWTCDKLAMKNHASEAGLADLHIPQTLWSGCDLGDLQAVRLPEHWVLKPNHRSGLIHFGHRQPDQRELSTVTATWLDTFEASKMREWAYATARPMLLAEELLGPPGAPPPDYKFFVFHGKTELIEMVNRYSGNQQRLYRADWTPLEVLYGPQQMAPVAPPPARLDRMLAVAEQLGHPFDFIRVDLYDVDGVVVFGELTPYPCGGLERFVPASFDVELGEKWQLPEL